MGMVYYMHRVNAGKLSKTITYNDIRTVVGEGQQIGDWLDREDFLFSLLDLENESLLSEHDLAAKNSVGDKHPEMLQALDMRIVSKKMVEQALKILKELDKKVLSMPYDKAFDGEYHCAGIADGKINDLSKYDYTEPCNSDKPWREDDLYYGPSKEFVDIIKEVEKVYGSRYYHYTFPWESNPEFGDSVGSYDIQRYLLDVLADMDAVRENEFVHVFFWE